MRVRGKLRARVGVRCGSRTVLLFTVVRANADFGHRGHLHRHLWVRGRVIWVRGRVRARARARTRAVGIRARFRVSASAGHLHRGFSLPVLAFQALQAALYLPRCHLAREGVLRSLEKVRLVSARLGLGVGLGVGAVG